MIITIDIKHRFGDILYLKSDKDQTPRVVTGYKIRPGNIVIYILAFYNQETEHYDFECTTEKDTLLTIT